MEMVETLLFLSMVEFVLIFWLAAQLKISKEKEMKVTICLNANEFDGLLKYGQCSGNNYKIILCFPFTRVRDFQA
jgi:hypothetical protein